MKLLLLRQLCRLDRFRGRRIGGSLVRVCAGIVHCAGIIRGSELAWIGPTRCRGLRALLARGRLEGKTRLVVVAASGPEDEESGNQDEDGGDAVEQGATIG